MDNGEEIRKHIGLVVTDERSFYWRLTGRQNLIFFCALHGMFGQQAITRADELLAAVDLSDVGTVRFDKYSSGMKQRLAIARGLLHRPKLLFLDEPGRSLDQQARERLNQLILKLNLENQMTIFLISHHLPQIESLCHRVGVMENGRLVKIDHIIPN